MSQNNNIAELVRPNGDPVEDPAILQPLYHFWSAQGRHFNRALVPAFNYWLRVPEEIVEKVTYISETTLASLYLYDDIEDGSELRRGKPAAHMVYGVPLTINCANYVMAVILEHVIALDHPKAMPVFVKELREVCRSVGKDIYNRETFNCPTEAEYERDYLAESLVAYNVPILLLKLFSKDERNLDKVIYMVAWFSLILSDYLNLKSDKLAKTKSYCQDLSEGKFNFLIVHAINSNHVDSAQVATILKQRTRDEGLKRHCVSLMEKIGSFAYTSEVLKKLGEEIQEEITSLGGNPMLEAFVAELAAIIEQM